MFSIYIKIQYKRTNRLSKHYLFSNDLYKIVFNIYKKYNTKELIDWVNIISNFLMDHRNRIRYTILEIAIIFGLQYQINDETKK